MAALDGALAGSGGRTRVVPASSMDALAEVDTLAILQKLRPSIVLGSEVRIVAQMGRDKVVRSAVVYVTAPDGSEEDEANCDVLAALDAMESVPALESADTRNIDFAASRAAYAARAASAELAAGVLDLEPGEEAPEGPGEEPPAAPSPPPGTKLARSEFFRVPRSAEAVVVLLEATPGAAPTGELLLPGDVVEAIAHHTIVGATEDNMFGGLGVGLFRGRPQKMLQLADDRGWVFEEKMSQFKGEWQPDVGAYCLRKGAPPVKLRTGPSLHAQPTGEIFVEGALATCGVFECLDDSKKSLDKKCVFLKLVDTSRGWALLRDKNTKYFNEEERLVL